MLSTVCSNKLTDRRSVAFVVGSDTVMFQAFPCNGISIMMSGSSLHSSPLTTGHNLSPKIGRYPRTYSFDENIRGQFLWELVSTVSIARLWLIVVATPQLIPLVGGSRPPQPRCAVPFNCMVAIDDYAIYVKS